MEGNQKDPAKTIFERINSGDAFARLTGMKLVEVQTGFARASLDITDDMLNVYQMAHGGAVFALADLVCEAASNSFGEMAVAVQTNIHFLSAGKSGDVLTATAKATNRSASLGVFEFEIRNHRGQLLSSGQQIVIHKKNKKRLS
jgi:acyl-CoA thioesterase